MHTQRPSSDHLPTGTEPMREEDVRRMLSAREQPAPKPQRTIRRFLIRLAILFTLYVLSIGPLYWRWYGAKVGLDSRTFLIFFHPLETLAKWFPPLGHFLNWYVSLWIY
jgi:hypothetical protein